MHTDDLPDGLELTSQGPIRTLTINRPARFNAINGDMHRALSRVWGLLRDDPDARAVVLTGAGRAFCAGGDVDMIRHTADDPEARAHTVRDARRIVTEMIDFPLPLIAAVNGPAVGLGASLALFCDIVLISEDAYLADPHVTVGLVAADGGALVWPLLTSLLKAKEYVFTGDRIPARRAEELGLANRVLPAESLLPEAYALAQRLAGQPRQALLDTKRVFNLHLNRAVSAVADFAFAAESESFTTSDFAKTLAKHAESGTR